MSETQHADELYRWEYGHGTQYLGKMGRMAFALFDFDDDGTVFPLLMEESDWKRRKNDFERVEPDDIPGRAVELIEEKFERRRTVFDCVRADNTSEPEGCE